MDLLKEKESILIGHVIGQSDEVLFCVCAHMNNTKFV